MRGRIYNPVIRRFMSPDPIVVEQGLSQAWNPYSYVLNSPLNMVDPTGLLPCSEKDQKALGPGETCNMTDDGKITITVPEVVIKVDGPKTNEATASTASSKTVTPPDGAPIVGPSTSPKADDAGTQPPSPRPDDTGPSEDMRNWIYSNWERNTGRSGRSSHCIHDGCRDFERQAREGREEARKAWQAWSEKNLPDLREHQNRETVFGVLFGIPLARLLPLPKIFPKSMHAIAEKTESLAKSRCMGSCVDAAVSNAIKGQMRGYSIEVRTVIFQNGDRHAVTILTDPITSQKGVLSWGYVYESTEAVAKRYGQPLVGSFSRGKSVGEVIENYGRTMPEWLSFPRSPATPGGPASPIY